MKPVVVFVLAFVVAGAAATGAKVAMTKPLPKPAATDSAHADSTHADSTKNAADTAKSGTDTAIVASGQVVMPPVDSARLAAPADSAKPKTTTPAAVPASAVATQAGAPASVPASAPAAPKADTVVQASERRIAKVFTSMDAKQAAKVLEHMADNDVHIILGYVGVKQAAQIMAALPPERVATLSKLAMGKK